jgi:hypothetical protein
MEIRVRMSKGGYFLVIAMEERRPFFDGLGNGSAQAAGRTHKCHTRRVARTRNIRTHDQPLARRRFTEGTPLKLLA